MGSNLQCEGQGRHRGAFVQEVVDKHRASLVVQGGCCSHQGIAERVHVCKTSCKRDGLASLFLCIGPRTWEPKGGGVLLLGTFFFSQTCASCSGSLGLVGGVRTNQNMPWLPGHLLQDLPPGKICLSNVGGATWWSEVR